MRAPTGSQLNLGVRRQPSSRVIWSTRHIEVPVQIELTAVFRAVPEGYIAFVEELPGANTQGATLDEARANLREAVELVLEANRVLAEEELVGEDVIREPLQLSA